MERQDQVARLRQTLADSRALIQQQLQNNELLEQQIGELLPCGFLDLPREMRDRMYDPLLVPGKVFIRPRPNEDPRLDDFDQCDPPQLQLLATNRQIRAEAAETLFTKNQIVLNNRNDAYGPLLKDEGTTHIPGSLSSFFHQHLTSVSIALDLHSYWPLTKDDNVMSFASQLRKDTDWNWEALSQKEREEVAHDDMHERSGHWQSIVGAVLAHFSTLRFFQIDVTNCYCVLGTCRLIGQVFSGLSYFHNDLQYYGPRLEIIEVLGTKTLDDRLTILSAFLNSPNYPLHTDSDRKPKLRFKAFRIPKDSTCINLHTSDLEDDLKDEEFDIHEMLQKGDINKQMVELRQRE